MQAGSTGLNVDKNPGHQGGLIKDDRGLGKSACFFPNYFKRIQKSTFP